MAIALNSVSYLNVTSAQEQSETSISCTPVKQFSRNRTRLECRFSSTDTETVFLVSEVTFPFQVTDVMKATSEYSGAIGLQYPEQVVEDTVFIGSVDWGDASADPRVQAIPFDKVSILLETNQSMGEVQEALNTQDVIVSYLAPNDANPLQPVFNTLEVNQSIEFDGTLILESFSQFATPGVLQFLRLGLACYEQTPEDCLANVIENL